MCETAGIARGCATKNITRVLCLDANHQPLPFAEMLEEFAWGSPIISGRMIEVQHWTSRGANDEGIDWVPPRSRNANLSAKNGPFVCGGHNWNFAAGRKSRLYNGKFS